MKKIDKKSPIPLHHQLSEIIRETIYNKELAPGDTLPTERELCEFHEISRMTARKAIQTLVHEGLIYREQGKGTFVAFPKERRDVSHLWGFTEEMKSKGQKISSIILVFELNESNRKICDILNLEYKSELVYEIKRVRNISDEPYAIEVANIPMKVMPGFTKEELEGDSLYRIMEEEYNRPISYAKETIEPVILRAFEKEVFGLEDVESPLGYLFERTTYDVNDEVIEYTKSIYRADIYKLEHKLERPNIL